MKSEAMSWFRYNLNYHPDQLIGEPKFILVENKIWQKVLGGIYLVKIPDTNFVVRYDSMLAYMNGSGPLRGLPVTVKNAQRIVLFFTEE